MPFKVKAETVRSAAWVPETLTFRVSVPPPPERLSPGLKVVPSVAPKDDPTTPLKVSLLLPPEKLVPASAPVVSVKVWIQKNLNISSISCYL